MNNQKLDASQKHDQAAINAFVDKRVGVTRKGLNLKAFIGIFIFGWLMKMNYDDLGEKGMGWAFIVASAVLFSIGRRQPEPMIFVVIGLIIYAGAWIHTNVLLTNKQVIAREQFYKENSKEDMNVEDVQQKVRTPATPPLHVLPSKGDSESLTLENQTKIIHGESFNHRIITEDEKIKILSLYNEYKRKYNFWSEKGIITKIQDELQIDRNLIEGVISQKGSDQNRPKQL
jgi:hypothetical protein